jgi:Na+-transporting NADH:ubiquinone oxidoreductase subunit NqrB
MWYQSKTTICWRSRTNFIQICVDLFKLFIFVFIPKKPPLLHQIHHQFSLNFSVFVHNHILNHLTKHPVKFHNLIQSFGWFPKFLEKLIKFWVSFWVDLRHEIVSRVVRDHFLSISVLELSSNTQNWVRYKHFSDFHDYFVVSGVLDNWPSRRSC